MPNPGVHALRRKEEGGRMQLKLAGGLLHLIGRRMLDSTRFTFS